MPFSKEDKTKLVEVGLNVKATALGSLCMTDFLNKVWTKNSINRLLL